jgi:LacI family transcriptional regulator
MLEKRVTLRDVATKAGVHFTTAGMALRGDARLKPETAQRIIAVAEKLGYRPDPMLSALADYRHREGATFHGIIGYLLPGPPPEVLRSNHGTRLSYEGATEHAREMGFKVEAFDITAPNLRSERMRQMLQARNVQGVILAPLPKPGPYPLDLGQDFSMVAIGYSVHGAALHRVCPHQQRGMRLQLRELAALGYRRVGLIISENGNERTEQNFLGAYLGLQATQPRAQRVEPLIVGAFTPRAIERWIAQQKPDCLIAEREAYEVLTALDYRFPADLGFSLITGNIGLPGVSCIREPWRVLGEAAVDVVLGLIRQRERGPARHPRYALVEGTWYAGNTLRARKPGASL